MYHDENVHPLHQDQAEAIENVYYWYDGNVPFYTDVTACRPLDDNFVPMNVHGYGYGYWYAADKTQVVLPHQVMVTPYFSQLCPWLTVRRTAVHERQPLSY